MKLLFSLLSVGVVSAHGDWKSHKETCSLPGLAKACAQDYEKNCQAVDDLDLVSLLACGKVHEASLQPTCLAEIKKSFPALYVCSEDIHQYCPSFGRLSEGQWGDDTTDNDDDDDDDDDGGRRHGRAPRHSYPQPPAQPAVPTTAQPAVPTTAEKPQPDPMQPFHGSWGSSRGDDSNAQCLKNALPAFSASCHNAIAEQWLAEQTKKGVTSPNQPTPDEIYQMLMPPTASPSGMSRMMNWKAHRVIVSVVAAGIACLALTCLCCCCRRCKKRRQRALRVEDAPELALSPIPEALAVPNSGYVPVAAPVVVHSVPQATPIPHATYMPYTGKGLGTYVPMAEQA